MTNFDGGQSGAEHSYHDGIGSESFHPTFGGDHSLFHNGHETSSAVHLGPESAHTQSYHDLMQTGDPLKMVHSMHMEPLNLGKTFTYPLGVDPYIHQDGSVVRGHTRYMPE